MAYGKDIGSNISKLTFFIMLIVVLYKHSSMKANFSHLQRTTTKISAGRPTVWATFYEMIINEKIYEF